MNTHRVELINRDRAKAFGIPETRDVACFPKGIVVRITLEVSEQQTILDAAEQAGLRLPVGCRFGACITCAARLIHGNVDQSQAKCLKPKQIAAGYVLLCVAYPRTDCQFEVGVESQTALYINPFQGK